MKTNYKKVKIISGIFITIVLLKLFSGFIIYNCPAIIGLNTNQTQALYFSGFTEGDTYSCEAKGFSGMKTIWEYESKQDKEITGNFDIYINSGKTKIVLIDGNGKQTVLFEVNAKGNETHEYIVNLPITKGNNRLKLVSSNVGVQNLSINVPKN